MHDEVLFSMITNINVRLQILNQLQVISFIISSLCIFLEDTKWLKSCVKIIRNLFSQTCRLTTRETFRKIFIDIELSNDFVQIQQRNLQFEVRAKIEEIAVENNYLQLWMFAWRHFSNFSTIASRKNVERQKFQTRALNDKRRQRLAQLIARLDFEFEHIKIYQKQNFDVKMTLNFLRQMRSMNVYHLSNYEYNRFLKKICQFFNEMNEKHLHIVITRKVSTN